LRNRRGPKPLAPGIVAESVGWMELPEGNEPLGIPVLPTVVYHTSLA
jgi:hypothetical protein